MSDKKSICNLNLRDSNIESLDVLAEMWQMSRSATADKVFGAFLQGEDLFKVGVDTATAMKRIQKKVQSRRKENGESAVENLA